MLIKLKWAVPILAVLMLFTGCSSDEKMVPFGQELTLAETTEISAIHLSHFAMELNFGARAC